MWNCLSLSFVEYHELTRVIEEFTCDEDKLRRLQDIGHLPLILADCTERSCHVTLAPRTLDVLSKIDSRFKNYSGTKVVSIDGISIDSHQVLLGHRESYQKLVLKKRQLIG